LSLRTRLVNRIDGPDVTGFPLSCGQFQHLTQTLHADQSASVLGLPILDFVDHRDQIVIAKALKRAPINCCPQTFESETRPAYVTLAGSDRKPGRFACA